MVWCFLLRFLFCVRVPWALSFTPSLSEHPRVKTTIHKPYAQSISSAHLEHFISLDIGLVYRLIDQILSRGLNDPSPMTELLGPSQASAKCPNGILTDNTIGMPSSRLPKSQTCWSRHADNCERSRRHVKCYVNCMCIRAPSCSRWYCCHGNYFVASGPMGWQIMGVSDSGPFQYKTLLRPMNGK